MSSNIRKVVGSFLMGAATVATVKAQIWSSCIDPQNNTPYSNPFGVGSVGNDLFLATMGFFGTVTYGGANGPCFAPTAITANVRGRIGFSIGNTGSIQSSFDDNMALTFGMPNEPGGSWSYATINVDGTRGLFGASTLTLAFVGASDRYIYGESTANNIRTVCRIDVVGDAARVNWNLTNVDTNNAHTTSLWFGQWIAMFAGSLDPATGVQFSGGPLGPQKSPYVWIPNGKPPLTDTTYVRAQDPTNFPPYVKFDFGQTTAYGFVVDNGPTVSTTDPKTGISDATTASAFEVGNNFFLLNAPDGGDNTFPDVIIPDTFLGQVAYIQKFPEQQLSPGATRTITQYFRSTWSVGNYAKPYAAVVDAPRLLATDDDGTGSTETNGLFKNPFTFRVYIDNCRGFSSVTDGIKLSDVKVKLTLPTGLNFVGFPTTTRTRQLVLSSVDVKEIRSVDFQVEADGVEFGNLPYQVDISPIPGPNKTITGTVQVAATPRYRLFDNGGPTANAMTTPFSFSDSSWQTVLGLTTPTDFVAYEWDPQIRGYINSTSAVRGKGVFIVNNTGAFQSNPLLGNPVTPNDTVPNNNDDNGRVVIQLKSGWNLIGNPYNYPIVLGQITGVAAANPSQSYSWSGLTSQGILNSFVSYWDASTQSYKFIQSTSDSLQPNTAYWVYVNTTQDVTLSFPPVFAEFLPGSGRSVTSRSETDKQWSLQLAVRSPKSIDDQNYIGIAPDTKTAKSLTAMEPPMSPTQDVALSIDSTLNGQPTRLAQNISDRQGRQEFTFEVQSVKGGDTNVTWPNMSAVPKTVHFRLIDLTTNATRDMRASSGYTFTASANSTRSFKVQVDTGVSTGPVISNIVAARVGRDRNSPFQINYSLASAASTTIRILSASGKEVFTVTRGRADNSGDNSATWNLKDNANRSVAPGTYRVEVTATTTDGTSVRRYVPINVVR